MGGTCLFVLVCFVLFTSALSQQVPALFAFGDSLVDPGNNNVLATSARGNHPPYGTDFINHQATGRFCNGRLVVDFLASRLGLPYPPAYHQDRSNILRGSNFGSASSGVLPQTHIQGAETFTSQVNNFQAVQRSLNQRLGSAEASRLISSSIFYICTANNDINNAFHAGGVSYGTMQSVITTFVGQIQRLYNMGARKFVIQGLSAVGCIPMNQVRGRCNPTANSAASTFNSMLNSEMASLRNSLRGSMIVVTNFYELMVQVSSNPGLFGFQDASSACCPEGSHALGCNQGVRVCPDRSRFAFWDAVHQTEAFNSLAANRWWSGSTNDVSPINISQLAAA